MTWDVTKPADSRNVSLGPADIRELKTDMQTALQVEHNFPVAADTPVTCHKIPHGNTASRPAAGNANRWFYNTTTQTIQRDTGSGWEDIVAPKGLVPSGTKMVFGQATAPTGWTKDTTYNDKMLRIVSGSGGGNGGSWTITLDNDTHSHSLWGPPYSFFPGLGPSSEIAHSYATKEARPGDISLFQTINNHNIDHIHSVGDSYSHEHTSNGTWRPLYLDAIVCTKD
jgi:hypothetical protein